MINGGGSCTVFVHQGEGGACDRFSDPLCAADGLDGRGLACAGFSLQEYSLPPTTPPPSRPVGPPCGQWSACGRDKSGLPVESHHLARGQALCTTVVVL